MANNDSPPLHDSNDILAQTSSQTSASQQNAQSRPSSSRAIAPAGAPNFPAAFQSIATTAPSPPAEHTNASLVGGPTSTSYVVPPRPKPGRKPATDEPASKRKAQNRESQRAFRARKAAKIVETQAALDSRVEAHKREQNEWMTQLATKEREIKELQAANVHLRNSLNAAELERKYWKDKHSNLDRAYQQLSDQLSNQDMNTWTNKQAFLFQTPLPNSRQASPTRHSGSSSAFTPAATTPQAYNTPKTVDYTCGKCNGVADCACIKEMAEQLSPTHTDMAPIALPSRASISPMKGMQMHNNFANDAALPFTSYSDREIDITQQYLSSRRSGRFERPIAVVDMMGVPSESCGFCTDASNCVCAPDVSTAMAKDVELGLSAHGLPGTASSKSKMPHSVTKIAPGSCSDCMRNPQQKAWCQRVAQLGESAHHEFPTTPPTSRNASITNTLDSVRPRADLLSAPDNRYSIGCSEAFNLFEGRVSVDHEIMDISNLRPVQRDTLPVADRKYSALELDTAGVIATLSHSMTPLVPRPSDGRNASIVKLASEQQRNNHSSRVSVSSDSPGLPVSSLINSPSKPNAPSGNWR